MEETAYWCLNEMHGSCTSLHYSVSTGCGGTRCEANRDFTGSSIDINAAPSTLCPVDELQTSFLYSETSEMWRYTSELKPENLGTSNITFCGLIQHKSVPYNIMNI